MRSMKSPFCAVISNIILTSFELFINITIFRIIIVLFRFIFDNILNLLKLRHEIIVLIKYEIILQGIS